MIQLSAQMRIIVAVEPVDFRKRIDGLAALCRAALAADAFSGAAFVFRSRSAKAIRVLYYDGQGFWLCEKRLSAGRFRFWPSGAKGEPASVLAAHQIHVLLSGGDPEAARGAPAWRRVAVEG
jgi:transposase